MLRPNWADLVEQQAAGQKKKNSQKAAVSYYCVISHGEFSKSLTCAEFLLFVWMGAGQWREERNSQIGSGVVMPHSHFGD